MDIEKWNEDSDCEINFKDNDEDREILDNIIQARDPYEIIVKKDIFI